MPFRVSLALLIGSIVLLPSATLGNDGGTWQPLAPLDTPRQETGAARIGDVVYVVGGLLDGLPLQATNTVEAYDIATDEWSFVPPMPQALDHMAVAASGGKLYVAGGYAGDFAARDELWIYDPVADDWDAGPPLPGPRGACWAVTLDGLIHVLGGASVSDPATTSHFVYDPVGNSWSTAAPMLDPREHHTAVVYDGRIIVIGGRVGFDSTNAVEEYDPVSDSWTALPPMPTPRSATATAVFDGRIYVAGGEVPLLFAINEAYDPFTGTWTCETPMSLARHGVPAIPLENGILVPGGGIVQGLLPTNQVDLFVPEARNFVRGDCDGNDTFSLVDAVTGLDYLFASGPLPPCLRACDFDADDLLGLADLVSLLNFLFLAGEPPAAPYPVCAETPNVTLHCAQSTCFP